MITLKYKNGTHLIINEDKTFLADPKAGTVLHQEQLKAKILDIAADKGRYAELYHATLHVAGEMVVEYGPIARNEPFAQPENTKVLKPSPKKVKSIKRAARNFRFTQLIRWNTDGVFITPYC